MKTIVNLEAALDIDINQRLVGDCKDITDALLC